MNNYKLNNYYKEYKELLFPFSVLLLTWIVVQYTLPLMPVDETRYVSVAWDMWLRKSYLVPHLNGEAYNHKPPMLFWIINAGWNFFEVNTITPRSISLFFSLTNILLIHKIASLLWPKDRDASLFAASMLASVPLWMMFSSIVMFDMLLTFWVLLGIWGIILSVRKQNFKSLFLITASIGGGILTKGPVIFVHILPSIFLASLWSIESKPNVGWYVKTSFALAAGTVMALLWAIPAGIEGGEEYRNAIFWGQTMNRVVFSFAHQQPVWWYLPQLPLLCFPWSLFKYSWTGIGLLKRDQGVKFCLIWFLSSLVIFSCISGKQIYYLIPSLPAIIMIFAKSVAATARWEYCRMLLIPLVYLFLAAAISFLPFAGFGTDVVKDKIETSLLAFISVGFFFVGFALLGIRYKNARILIKGIGLSSLLLISTILICLKSAIHEKYDLEKVSLLLKEKENQGTPIGKIGKYHGQYHFMGRLKKPISVLEGKKEISRYANNHPEAVIIDYVNAHEAVDAENIYFEQPYRGKKLVLWKARNYEKNRFGPDAYMKAAIQNSK